MVTEPDMHELSLRANIGQRRISFMPIDGKIPRFISMSLVYLRFLKKN